MTDENKSILMIPGVGKAAKADFLNLGISTFKDLI